MFPDFPSSTAKYRKKCQGADRHIEVEHRCVANPNPEIRPSGTAKFCTECVSARPDVRVSNYNRHGRFERLRKAKNKFEQDNWVSSEQEAGLPTTGRWHSIVHFYVIQRYITKSTRVHRCFVSCIWSTSLIHVHNFFNFRFRLYLQRIQIWRLSFRHTLQHPWPWSISWFKQPALSWFASLLRQYFQPPFNMTLSVCHCKWIPAGEQREKGERVWWNVRIHFANVEIQFDCARTCLLPSLYNCLYF